MSGIFPGWGSLVSQQKQLSSYVFEVALRYRMCTQTQEDPLLSVITDNPSLRKSFAVSNSYHSVDDRDAKQVATSQLYKAAFRRAWNEISAIDQISSYHNSVITLYQLYEDHGKRAASARVILDLALSWDLCEMYVYTLLFPYSALGKSIKAGKSHISLPRVYPINAIFVAPLGERFPENLAIQTARVLYTFGERTSALRLSVDPTYTFFHTWEKLNSHITSLRVVLGNTRRFKGFDMIVLCHCQQADWVYAHQPHLLECLTATGSKGLPFGQYPKVSSVAMDHYHDHGYPILPSSTRGSTDASSPKSRLTRRTAFIGCIRLSGMPALVMFRRCFPTNRLPKAQISQFQDLWTFYRCRWSGAQLFK
ncbi:hypothetical protein B0J17DRAFT_710396 [Rhizoctonia solani]|nr:hypothetical protein B0J17DRAFT_710396 [Rhizoctonia solani]